MDCSLSHFVESNSSIPVHNVLSILHDISLGMWYLHNRDPPLMHRDLSPNDVLLYTTSLVAKITADFVYTKEELLSEYRDEQYDDSIPGNYAFSPPEVLSDWPVCTPKTNVFSYGAVALYVAAGEWPFPNNLKCYDPRTNRVTVLTEIQRRQQYLDKLTKEVTLLRPLLEECLANDPERRPTIADVSTRIKKIKESSKAHHLDIKVPNSKLRTFNCACTCVGSSFTFCF